MLYTIAHKKTVEPFDVKKSFGKGKFVKEIVDRGYQKIRKLLQ